MPKEYPVKYDDIARTLAAVSFSLGSYSLIDRLANALSPDVILRAVYEMSRSLSAMSKPGGTPFVQQIDDKTPKIEISMGEEKTPKKYELQGSLATPSRISEFLDQASRDIRIARSVAAYAMYLAADLSVKGSKGVSAK
jgi:CRISPR type I-A-associated protein Csa5